MVVLCVISAVFVLIQNIVGTAGALAFGMPSAAGVVMGSMALSGGHGTTIAWGPLIATEHDFPAAMETGIAAATLGLIIACVLGGPIAKYLIEKHGLQPSSAELAPIELAPEDDKAPIDKMGVMQAMLVVNIAVILGYLVHHWISNATTIKVPLFVPCLIMGMVLSNACPRLIPRWPWPARTASLDLISSYSLSIFLAMSLMSMQLWTLAKIAGPLLVIVGVQTLLAAIYTLLVVFPALGKDYQAAVLSAGFTQHITWFNTDGHRNHDGGYQTLRTIAQCFRYSAAGISFVCQSIQCRRDCIVFIFIDGADRRVGGAGT